MRLDQRTLLTLIEQIYEAAVDPSGWPSFLETFSNAFRGQTMLFAYDLRRSDASIVGHTFDEEFVRSYIEYYGSKNLFFEKGKSLPVGAFVSKEGNFERSEYENSEFYNDWVLPQGFVEFGGTKLLDTGSVLAAIAVHRGGGPAALDREEIDCWTQLVPHLQRAIQVHRQLFSAQLRSDAALQALDQLGVGVILTSQESGVLFSNCIAERILRSGRGLRVVSGRLCAETSSATGHIQHMIHEVALTSAGKGTQSGGILPVPQASGRPLPVLISPVRAGDRLLGPSGPAALVLVADPQQPRGADGPVLMRVYGLSHAEARLLSALTSGLSLAEYAESAGISIGTARTQLKQVFAKTGEHRQSDLIRRVLTDPILGHLSSR